ncbi:MULTISPECIES: RNA polymerase factor sigma-54 [unclassified Bacillus (in: firmicutes)]|uniref:RNA polymerase factor sigma-54 n=1 Tax=unclassified Bacillus (in: firmicutes) TaxID=185979 RepID=UPI0013273ED2|nr:MULTISPECIES: RNA polymerase factor sigma-54 [unclassified Bacillus (in: firmicutes)]MDN4636071.1 RNA polymerase factor sigma-54 [Bacillus sp. PsM16]MXP81550.1 RNA polymerase factor sigma-54 [Bacillus sp. AN2]
MSLKLQQELVLKQVLTQELRQAITLLQLNCAELGEYLDQLALENPLIERKDTDSYQPVYHKKTQDRMTEPYRTHQKESLQMYLKRQAIDLNLSEKNQRIFQFMIESIDSNGYLNEPVDQMAAVLQASAEEVEAVLHQLQSLEPAGIGARSLQECILLQLRRKKDRWYEAELIIEGHFFLFARKAWKEIAAKTGMPLKTLQAIQDEVSLLEPRPGLHFSYEDQDVYIEPDVLITAAGGHITFELNQRAFPDIEMNEGYFAMIQDQKRHEAYAYLKEKHQQYNWLVQALKQRKQTMTNVVREIILQQTDFFLTGKHKMKPLTMKRVADILQVHESTVSRTVKGKMVQTPYGLMEMKQFFQAKLEGHSLEEASSYTVKTHIAELIQSENKKKPYSDQQIMTQLQQTFGIRVSRRTIAKYREQMNLPSSTLRKRYD